MSAWCQHHEPSPTFFFFFLLSGPAKSYLAGPRPVPCIRGSCLARNKRPVAATPSLRVMPSSGVQGRSILLRRVLRIHPTPRHPPKNNPRTSPPCRPMGTSGAASSSPLSPAASTPPPPPATNPASAYAHLHQPSLRRFLLDVHLLRAWPWPLHC